MFTSKGMELHDIGQKVLWAGAQIAARVAEAREVNDGLRALFLPHGRRPCTQVRLLSPSESFVGKQGFNYAAAISAEMIGASR